MGKKSVYSKTEIKNTIDLHNKERAEVGSKPIKWSDEVAEYAQEWADELAKKGAFKHRRNGKYGENIYKAWGGNLTPSDATKAWASEKPLWSGGVFTKADMPAGHYTQMIWNNTNHVGCGKAVGADGSVVIVCNYDPNGNWLNQNPVD